MTSGNRKRRRLSIITLLLVPWIAQAAPDVSTLIASIKKPTPTNIAFTEVRYSRLLKQPIIVTGQLSFRGVGHFDRTVERPFREHTEISNDSVRVSREGEPERSFALKRAPELRTLLLTFSALLSGEQAAIERDFKLSVAGDSQYWSLDLVPLDSRVQRHLDRVSIIGKNELPRCFSIYTRDGSASILLLGSLASIDIAPTVTQEALLQHCRSGQ